VGMVKRASSSIVPRSDDNMRKEEEFQFNMFKTAIKVFTPIAVAILFVTIMSVAFGVIGFMVSFFLVAGGVLSFVIAMNMRDTARIQHNRNRW
jgi:small neutral amino acid transporter SnatA (MarC family)